MTKSTSVHSLDRPENLQDLLRQDRQDDCTSCRLIGGFTFVGLGAYTYLSGQTQLEKQRELILKSGSRFGIRSRKLAVAGMSLGLAWMGVWRLVR